MKYPSVHIYLLFIMLGTGVIAQNFYDVEQINTVEVFFEQSNWDSILHQYWFDAEGQRLHGAVIINGERFEDVGIRYKGFSSYDEDYPQKPLNIELDDIISDQNYQGIKTVKLANGWRDPSFIREILGYDIIRDYMPASRANFADVYINDEYFGIYNSTETVDKNFLENHFHENEGIFIKGDPPMIKGGYGFKGSSDLRYVGTDELKYYNSYDLKSDTGWTDLIELCDILNNRFDEIETVLNADRVLWFLAYHNLLVSLDSPISTARNYYLYKDINGIFQIIPWDLNMTFGTYRLINGSWDTTLEELQRLDHLYHIDSDRLHLIRQFLQHERYKKIYIAHMRTILKEKFLSGWYEDRAKYLQGLIDNKVKNDDKKYYSYEDFKNNLDNSVIDDRRLLVGIAELMEGRKNYLDLLFLALYTEPKIHSTIVNTESFKADSTILITSETEHADSVRFIYRTSLTSPFIKVNMYDNGTNGDSTENDGIYCATVKLFTGRIQYYIYAENSIAARFSPEGAQYRLHELHIKSGLVINEFLALNDTTTADQDDEFDDWIELYNNGDSVISLNNYFLSDNAENLFKWQFPDTVIEPQDFLMIWADEDGGQSGLHTNFKLSGNGEVIFLVNADSQVVDEVVFAAQKRDISTGRLPNGTGEFTKLLPSFGSANLVEYEEIEPEIPEDFLLQQNYPNPFNPKTMINYQLSMNSDVNLSIYNVLGQKVITLVNENQPAGDYEVEWDASGFASGVYFYRLQAGNYHEIKKAIFIR